MQVNPLLALQDLDDQIAKLQREIVALKGERGFLERLAQAQSQERELSLQLEKLQERQRQNNAREEELQVRAQRLHAKLYGGSVINPKELKDLQGELLETKTKQESLQEILLLGMEEEEDLTQKLTTQRQELEKLERDAKQHLAHLLRQIKRRQERIASLQTERQKARQPLEQQLLYAYDNLHKSKGGRAVAEVTNNQCSGCGARMPEHKLNELRQNRLSFCETCGRLLALRRFFESRT